MIFFFFNNNWHIKGSNWNTHDSEDIPTSEFRRGKLIDLSIFLPISLTTLYCKISSGIMFICRRRIANLINNLKIFHSHRANYLIRNSFHTFRTIFVCLDCAAVEDLFYEFTLERHRNFLAWATSATSYTDRNLRATDVCFADSL